MSVTDAYVFDSRKVRLHLTGHRYVSFTPAGNMPIVCHTVVIRYDIPTRHVTSVEVRGLLVNEADRKRRASTLTRFADETARGPLTRRYKVAWKTGEVADPPAWLEELIEQHRPPKAPA